MLYFLFMQIWAANSIMFSHELSLEILMLPEFPQVTSSGTLRGTKVDVLQKRTAGVSGNKSNIPCSV